MIPRRGGLGHGGLGGWGGWLRAIVVKGGGPFHRVDQLFPFDLQGSIGPFRLFGAAEALLGPLMETRGQLIELLEAPIDTFQLGQPVRCYVKPQPDQSGEASGVIDQEGKAREPFA